MHQARATDSDSQLQRSGESFAFAAIAVLCLGLIAGLWAISRNADSARQLESISLQTQPVSGEQGCKNFADFWMIESGAAIPAEAISGLSNCRLDSDGAWFVPTGPDDPRLPAGYRLTLDEKRLVDPLEQQLSGDLDDLEITIPRSLRESLKANYNADNEPVFGHTRRGRTDLSAKRSRYLLIAQPFLLDPRRAVIADYVAWTMQRKESAATRFEAACSARPDLSYLLRACDGVRNEFAVSVVPLYWELKDPLLIREYLMYRARSGEPFPVFEPMIVAY